MTSTKLQGRIAMLETTLANDSDVLSLSAKASLRESIARLRELVEWEERVERERVKQIEITDAVIAEDNYNVGGLAQAVAARMVVQPTIPQLQITTPAAVVSSTFVKAGKAIFTVNNPNGERYTFKIERPDSFRGEYFASVMKGSDNEHDYRYVGMMSESFALRFTKGSKFGPSTVEARVLAFAFERISGRKAIPNGYAIRHAGKCGRCARTLTVPESIDSGIGPECARLMAAA